MTPCVGLDPATIGICERLDDLRQLVHAVLFSVELATVVVGFVVVVYVMRKLFARA